MKRTKHNNKPIPNLILTSDWHLREDQPPCRTDNFWEAQWANVLEITKLQKKYDCPVFHAGDFFNHWKPSPFLLSETIIVLPEQFNTIYGQHDLPQHNLDLAYKSGIATLKNSGTLWTFIFRGSWGTVPDKIPDTYRMSGKEVFMWHKLIWEKKAPPWSDAPTAKQILKEYPQYDLIVTGDNHASFVVEHEGRLLVNPGSLTRQTADQAKHKPSVYLWYAETNTVKRVELPIEQGVISREHIDKNKKRDARIAAFVSRLQDDWEVGVSFERNLKRFLKKNKISDKVEAIIREAMEE